MDAAEVLRRYAEAFGRGDVSGLARLYAEKTRYEQPFLPEPITEPGGVAAFESGMFSAFGDISVDIDWIVADGDRAAAGMVVHATHTGPMPTPDGSMIEATGRRITLPTAEYLLVDDAGLIVEHRRYLDGMGFMAQLGLVG